MDDRHSQRYSILALRQIYHLATAYVFISVFPKMVSVSYPTIQYSMMWHDKEFVKKKDGSPHVTKIQFKEQNKNKLNTSVNAITRQRNTAAKDTIWFRASLLTFTGRPSRDIAGCDFSDSRALSAGLDEVSAPTAAGVGGTVLVLVAVGSDWNWAPETNVTNSRWNYRRLSASSQ